MSGRQLAGVEEMALHEGVSLQSHERQQRCDGTPGPFDPVKSRTVVAVLQESGEDELGSVAVSAARVCDGWQDEK